jgi:hypothetical protein
MYRKTVPYVSESGSIDYRYASTSPSGAADVNVRFFALAGTVPMAERIVSLLPPEGRTSLPPPGDFPRWPAYAELPAISALLPALGQTARIRIEVEPLTPGLVFWTFVSVTNNSTQQVTTITPQ